MKNILLERQLQCSAVEAWQMWTNPTLLASFFGEHHKIELKSGGAYEIYFSMKEPIGERGSEKCTIIDFEEGKNLSFTWNAPPSIPLARKSHHFTKVELNFIEKHNEESIIKLVHSGWDLQGEHWEKTNEYFSQAWPYVLNQLELAINKKQ